MSTEQLRSLVLSLQAEMLPPRVNGYGRRLFPCELDTKLGTLAGQFLDTVPSEHMAICREFGLDHSFALLAYAQRMAEQAVCANDPDMLRRGLVAVAIEGFRYDRRETIPVLSLLYHSAERIGVDPAALLCEVADVSTPGVRSELMAFANRAPEDRRISAMGYRTEDSGTGFRYVRDW